MDALGFSNLLENLISVSERLENVLDRGSKIRRGLQDHLSKRVGDFKQWLELIYIPRYSLDFDIYLEEDVPSAVRVCEDSKPSLKMASCLRLITQLMVSCYTPCSHDMDLKEWNQGLLLSPLSHQHLTIHPHFSSTHEPLTALLHSLNGKNDSINVDWFQKEPAQAINMPIMRTDTMLAMAHPLICRPPYALSWLTTNLSAPQMMDPELIEKLVLNSLCKYNYLTFSQASANYIRLSPVTFFPCKNIKIKLGTVLVKLLLQLIQPWKVGCVTGPVLSTTRIISAKPMCRNVALAGDWNITCPSDAVYLVTLQHL